MGPDYPIPLSLIIVQRFDWQAFDCVHDEQQNDDSLYDIDGLFFIISKEDEKYVKYIEIDYIDDWSGADFVITAGF